VNISGTHEAIDMRFFFTFDENNLANYGPLTKKTLTFNL